MLDADRWHEELCTMVCTFIEEDWDPWVEAAREELEDAGGNEGMAAMGLESRLCDALKSGIPSVPRLYADILTWALDGVDLYGLARELVRDANKK